MPDTVNLLETALENEAGLFLRMINELENQDLFEFIRRVSDLEPRPRSNATEQILHIAHNIRNIEAAAENFYRV